MKERKTDREILATSTRRVIEKTPEISGAPFGDWLEVLVNKVDAGKNTMAEAYDSERQQLDKARRGAL